MIKELIDAGMLNLPTHYCETCNIEAQERVDVKLPDVIKMCLSCTINHTMNRREHKLVLIMPIQLIT